MEIATAAAVEDDKVGLEALVTAASEDVVAVADAVLVLFEPFLPWASVLVAVVLEALVAVVLLDALPPPALLVAWPVAAELEEAATVWPLRIR